MEDDPPAEEEVGEFRRQPALVSRLEVPTRSPGGGKSVKARGGQPDLLSSLGDGESALKFIGATF